MVSLLFQRMDLPSKDCSKSVPRPSVRLRFAWDVGVQTIIQARTLVVHLGALRIVHSLLVLQLSLGD